MKIDNIEHYSKSPFAVADFPFHIYESWSRIYDGQEANNVIPYQVRMIVGNGDKNRGPWLCGGTIISRKHVLTARHCIESNELGFAKLSSTYVEAGFYSLAHKESFPYQVCFVLL